MWWAREQVGVSIGERARNGGGTRARQIGERNKETRRDQEDHDKEQRKGKVGLQKGGRERGVTIGVQRGKKGVKNTGMGRSDVSFQLMQQSPHGLSGH